MESLIDDETLSRFAQVIPDIETIRDKLHSLTGIRPDEIRISFAFWNYLNRPVIILGMNVVVDFDLIQDNAWMIPDIRNIQSLETE